MMKYLQRFLLTILLIVLLLGGGFVAWALNASPAGPVALDSLISDEQIRITQTADYIAFEPVSQQPLTGLIFYPGGRVDYRAYAPLLRQVAQQGYLVVLVPVSLNLAFFDLEAGAPALVDFPQIQTWAVGRHSLGGVAASLFAQSHPEVSGLVLWASTPANEDLKSIGIRALSISCSLDGLFLAEDLQSSRGLLPAGSLFLTLEGGNHAQFGDYGPQPGDNPAVISADEQWQRTARATAGFLNCLKNKTADYQCEESILD